jgi:hypothetical protein
MLEAAKKLVAASRSMEYNLKSKSGRGSGCSSIERCTRLSTTMMVGPGCLGRKPTGKSALDAFNNEAMKDLGVAFEFYEGPEGEDPVQEGYGLIERDPPGGPETYIPVYRRKR